MSKILQLPCRQYKNGQWRQIDDLVSLEEKIHIHWPGQEVKTLWAYPEDLTSLVIGHCAIELCAPDERPELVKKEGCEFHLKPVPIEPDNDTELPKLSKALILENMARFMALDGKWEKTGCFHRAALYEPGKNDFVHYVEDIGRHNCLDRLKGWAVKNNKSMGSLILFVSARGTASLILKAVKAGFQAVVSRSALTSASIELALKKGLTLIGFARENRFSVFTDPKGLVI
jgi:FdhD protein